MLRPRPGRILQGLKRARMRREKQARLRRDNEKLRKTGNNYPIEIPIHSKDRKNPFLL